MTKRACLYRYYRIDFPDGTKAHRCFSVDYVWGVVGRQLEAGAWRPWEVLGCYSKLQTASDREAEWMRGKSVLTAQIARCRLVEVHKPHRRRVAMRLPDGRTVVTHYAPEWGERRPYAVLVEDPSGLQPKATWLTGPGRPAQSPGALLLPVPPEKPCLPVPPTTGSIASRSPTPTG